MPIPIAALTALPWGKIARIGALAVAVIGTVGTVYAGYTYVSNQSDSRVEAEVRASKWEAAVTALQVENRGYRDAIEGYQAAAAEMVADRDAWIAKYTELSEREPAVVERRTEIVERIPETIVSIECSEAAAEALTVVRALAAP